jgi:hypothetical protein
MNKKRNSNYMKLAGLLMFLFVSSGVFAQVNFAGTWVYNQAKSVIPQAPNGMGGGGGPMGGGGGGLTVTQDAKTITSTQTMQGPDGEMQMVNKYNIDGTVTENTVFGDMKRKSTLTWSADKKAATIVSVMVFDMNGESREMKTTETWKLADDGKTLLIESVRPAGPDGGEPMKTTRGYDKK